MQATALLLVQERRQSPLGLVRVVLASPPLEAKPVPVRGLLTARYAYELTPFALAVPGLPSALILALGLYGRACICVTPVRAFGATTRNTLPAPVCEILMANAAQRISARVL